MTLAPDVCPAAHMLNDALQWGATCSDCKGVGGCAALCSSCRTGSLSGYLWYMPINNKRYYSVVLGGGLLEVFGLSR